nr:transposase, MuDR [Tanacetum cinerariifolium]
DHPEVFSMKVFHGGTFAPSPNRKYFGGKVQYVDLLDIECFTIDILHNIVKMLKYASRDIMFYHFNIPNKTLDWGLRALESEDDVVNLSIRRWRYNLIPAESIFKTPCSIIKDKYMMKAQISFLYYICQNGSVTNYGEEGSWEDNVESYDGEEGSGEDNVKSYADEGDVDPLRPQVNINEDDLEVIDYDSFESDVGDDHVNSDRRKVLRKLKRKGKADGDRTL